MVIKGAGQSALLSYFEAMNISETSGAGQGSSTGSQAVAVDISQAALAQSRGSQQGVAFPPLLVTEDVMRWSLTRIFMDTLFGNKDQNSHKAETGLVEGVIDEATFKAQLEIAKREKGNGQP